MNVYLYSEVGKYLKRIYYLFLPKLDYTHKQLTSKIFNSAGAYKILLINNFFIWNNPVYNIKCEKFDL